MVNRKYFRLVIFKGYTLRVLSLLSSNTIHPVLVSALVRRLETCGRQPAFPYDAHETQRNIARSQLRSAGSFPLKVEGKVPRKFHLKLTDLWTMLAG
jgi:hypothetical protein